MVNSPDDDRIAPSAEMARAAEDVIDALADEWQVTPKPPNIIGLQFEDAAFLALLWNRYQLLNGLGEAEAAERLYEKLQRAEYIAHGHK